ncbi:hypothetical protein ACFL0Z_02570 [Patescibacteria group bacterium]
MTKNTIIALVLGLVIGGLAVWLLLSFGGLAGTAILPVPKPATIQDESVNEVTLDAEAQVAFDSVVANVANDKTKITDLAASALAENGYDASTLDYEVAIFLASEPWTDSMIDSLKEYYRYPDSALLAYGVTTSPTSISSLPSLFKTANADEYTPEITRMEAHVGNGVRKCQWDTIKSPSNIPQIITATETSTIANGIVKAADEVGFLTENDMTKNAGGEVYPAIAVFFATQPVSSIIDDTASVKHPSIWGWLSHDTDIDKDVIYDKIRVHYKGCKTKTYHTTPW